VENAAPSLLRRKGKKKPVPESRGRDDGLSFLPSREGRGEKSPRTKRAALFSAPGGRGKARTRGGPFYLFFLSGAKYGGG